METKSFVAFLLASLCFFAGSAEGAEKVWSQPKAQVVDGTPNWESEMKYIYDGNPGSATNLEEVDQGGSFFGITFKGTPTVNAVRWLNNSTYYNHITQFEVWALPAGSEEWVLVVPSQSSLEHYNWVETDFSTGPIKVKAVKVVYTGMLWSAPVGEIEFSCKETVVSLFSKDKIATESGDRGVFHIVRKNNTENELQIKLAITGTATNGKDYEKIGQSVLFKPGISKQAIRIKPLQDDFKEGTENVIISLLKGSGYLMANLNSDEVIFYDDETPNDLLIEDVGPSPLCSLCNDIGKFKVTRIGDLSKKLIVYFDYQGYADPVKVGVNFYNGPRNIDTKYAKMRGKN